MKIEIPEKYRNENGFSKRILEEILMALDLGDLADYELKGVKRYGRHIVITHDKSSTTHKFFVLLSNSNISGGRNSLIAQYVVTSYFFYINDSSDSVNKSIHLFYHTDLNPTTVTAEYHGFMNRVINTLGVDVINQKYYFPTNQLAFQNAQEYYSERFRIRSRNTGNISSYFVFDQSNYLFYGKVFGANGKESILLATALRKLTDIKIKFYMVEDNETSEVGTNDKLLLDYFDIELTGSLPRMQRTTNTQNVESIRNTALFHNNLTQKFGVKKCFLCECDIEQAIIGAHIHRVTDIEHDDSITIEEKNNQAADGENGLWLCRNHDILFEVGLIYFEGNNLKINNHLNKKQISFVNEITKKYDIDSKYYSRDMQKYLSFHKSRISKYNSLL